MPQRRLGEKIGWLGGFAGGFLWIPPLAILFMIRGQLLAGCVGIALCVIGYGAVIRLTPWRYPNTAYWRLLLIPYLILLCTLPWAIWGFGPETADLDWWLLMPMLALLSPFVTIGTRRWGDGDQD
ncbi:MAG: hypothetical protein EOM91_13860 [Sphingobacteriia bacterium]|nr:hypothetical protein [Sphingobacteriia bacterium]